MNVDLIFSLDCSCEYMQLELSWNSQPQNNRPPSRERILHVEQRGLRHSEALMPALRSIMATWELTAENIDGIVCSSGPGSFTGLRIAMAAAKGLSAACRIPLISVSALDALTHSLRHLPGILLPAIDAKKNRFYCALYRNTPANATQGWAASVDTILPHSDLSPERLAKTVSENLKSKENLWIAGPHGQMLWEKLRPMLQAQAESSTIVALPFGEWVGGMSDLGRIRLKAGEKDPDDTGPEYLRVSEADLGISRKPNL